MEGAVAAVEVEVRHRTVAASPCTWRRPAPSTAAARWCCSCTGSRSCGTRGGTRWRTWRPGATAASRSTSAATAAPPRPPPPPDVDSYNAFHLVGDVVALLDALALPKAEQMTVFVVGHDWGALIAWYLCLFRPDRVTALVNTSVAFMRHVMIRAGAGAVKTTDYFHRAYGPTYYICRFQEPGVAEKEFAPAHARRLMEKILCNRFSERAAGEPEPPLPPWLTEADIDYFAAAFEKTGFTGAINYYRNMDRNWELAAAWADAKVRVPTKFIVGDGDLTYHYAGIQEYLHKGGFKADVPLLEEVVVIPGAGHFIQQE